MLVKMLCQHWRDGERKRVRHNGRKGGEWVTQRGEERKVSSELRWCSPGTSWFGLGNEDRSSKELAQTRALTQTPAGSSVKTVRTLLENRHDRWPKITFEYQQEKQPAEALTRHAAS